MNELTVHTLANSGSMWRLPVGMAVLLGLGCPSSAQDLAEPRLDTFRGTVQAVVEDHWDTHSSTLSYSIHLDDDMYMPVLSPTPRIRAAAITGEPVTFLGFRKHDALYPQPEAQEESVPAAAAVAQTALGVRNVVLIPVTFLNARQAVIDRTNANQIIIDRLKKFYQEASYGAFSVQVDVTDPVALNLMQDCTAAGSFNAITNAGIQAASAAGINLSKYESYMFVGADALHLSDSTKYCPSTATLGAAPGRILILLASPSVLGVIPEHELGHNLGLDHSHSYYCGNVIYNPNVVCSIVEYGDFFDAMGKNTGAVPHFNAAYKELLGWLRSQDVTTSGTFDIPPVEFTPAALRVLPPVAADMFYVEYRQPLGFDATIPFPAGFKGPLTHLGGNPSFILNMHPASARPDGAPDPALYPGDTYVDYENRFSIATLSATPASVKVQILMPGAGTPAALFNTPLNGSPVSGTVRVVIGALDRKGIAKVELYRDGALFGTATSAPYSFFWDTTKDSTGLHQLSVTAYNTSGATASQAISVTVHRPPVIVLAAPPAAAPGNPIPLSAQATAEPGATIASVEFFASTVSLGLGKPAGPGVYSLTWTPPGPGTYVFSAKATDNNGLTAVSATASVTVIAASIASVNISGGGPDIAPNAWIEIHGLNLAPPGTPVAGLTWDHAPEFNSGTMPTKLNNLGVTVNGKAAFIYFVSNDQVNVLTPLEATEGPVDIAMSNGAHFTANRSAYAPSFFLFGSTKYIAATHADGSYVGPRNLYPGLSSPAKPGETIVLYGTGFGLPVSPLIEGSAKQSGVLPAAPSIIIGGLSAEVKFAGVICPGLYQLNVVVPLKVAPGDDYVLPGFVSAPLRLITVEP